uniref:Gibberellin-regulated protein 9 n=1 Tax=Anthurium amnicola TaxID=1678845 RepID=A0A1D1XXH6_9ARAE
MLWYSMVYQILFLSAHKEGGGRRKRSQSLYKRSPPLCLHSSTGFSSLGIEMLAMSGHAMKRLSCFLVLFLLFLQVFAEASPESGMVYKDASGGVAAALPKSYSRPKINCKFACARRCSKASRQNFCSRACGACCLKCHCVPPGTYGNTHMCPCYASLRTHGHKPKCP